MSLLVVHSEIKRALLKIASKIDAIEIETCNEKSFLPEIILLKITTATNDPKEAYIVTNGT